MSHVRTTRLAPSPTGALHLGNARTFLINWALARRNNWNIILRIEDLDGPRIKVGADQMAIDDLRWLGLDWDTQAPHQRSDLSPYQTALAQLAQQGLTYACICSRRDIEQAQSAPHAEDQEMRYPGTCRDAPHPASGEFALRIRIPDEPITFDDQFSGPQSFNVQQQAGDFIVATKAGLPAYQLAVVVDDARQNVTDIVRGDDLLPSAARQFWLYHFLNLRPLPQYWHLPLVVGQDGRRLAKRHGDTRVAWYRQQGVPAERIIGLVAYWSGIATTRSPMSAVAFRDAFEIERVPASVITFTAEDHAWLLA